MNKKHFAHDIRWDTDGDMKLFKSLPQKIEIPDWVWEEYEDGYDDAISEYVSDVTGFCHYGFEIRTENIKEENTMTNITIYDRIQLGDIFHNDNGTDYTILAFNKEADVALLLNPKNKFTPYVGANGLRDGHWCHGHYFRTIQDASEWYNSIINETF